MMEILRVQAVTAIASDPQKNIDFYAGVLGLRLVKITVNYDARTSYHLYYGDGQGRAGTIMTFFPWPGAIARRIGTGQLTVTSFAVPEKPLGYRKIRLRERGISVQETRSEFDEAVLFFADRDGLQLELVATSHVNPNRVWSRGPVPADFAIRSFHDVTLSESGYERTASLLTDNLGFRRLQERSARFRYAVGTGMPGTIVDLICALEGPSGRVAVGTVHHVAWRTPTDKQQVKWRARLYETCSTT